MTGWILKEPGYFYNPRFYNLMLFDGVWMVQKRRTNEIYASAHQHDESGRSHYRKHSKGGDL